jgi:D-lactate dehydrogenase (cytochrome)
MATHRIAARKPRGRLLRPAVVSGQDAVGSYLRDAAGTPGGHTPCVALPRDEAEVAWVLREAPAVLPVGAQSSLTGGATPFGAWVLSLSRMSDVLAVGSDRARMQAGVALLSLEERLHPLGLFYPPVPTFRGAFAGGVASTNASGAATFKYGSTRDWIDSLTVVLASGDVLDVERGSCRAHADGYFEVVTTDGGSRRVPAPGYAMPQVPKRSAGYHAEPEMDLLDLFLGSEGTLGVITEVEVRVIPRPPRFLAWAGFGGESTALAFASRLREAARATWSSGDPRGLDVAAIESVDRRCLRLLREDGTDREQGVTFPEETDTALLIQMELPAGTRAASLTEEMSRFDDDVPPDTPVTRLLRLLQEHGALESFQWALPGEERRQAQLLSLREAVPLAVNHRVAAAQRGGQPEVQKTAADMVVAFEHLPEMVGRYREGFERRGLDHALWGHVSDGNLHANVIPRSLSDVWQGEEAILEFGDEVIRLGGCPLSEHGVGRHPVKQELLRRLYGDAGIAEMRHVKAALDPEWKLAPGVLFPRSGLD